MSKDRKDQDSKEKKKAPGSDKISGKSKPVSEFKPEGKSGKNTSTQRADSKSDGKRKA